MSFGCHLGVPQERQCNVLVVSTGFRITQDLGDLLVVAATQHEAHVVESLLSHQRQSFRLNLKHGFAFKLAHANIILGEQIVFRLVLAELEHRCVLEFHKYYLVI